VPGGTLRNLEWARERLDAGATDEILVTLLADAQTSGGLLFGAAPHAAAEAVARLRASGHTAAVIGEVGAGSGTLHLR
jgi:selenide,water dikinase